MILCLKQNIWIFKNSLILIIEPLPAITGIQVIGKTCRLPITVSVFCKL